MARTALMIDEKLQFDMKSLAAARGERPSAVVDEFLREGLERAKSALRPKAAALRLGGNLA
jgi:hypothetical protein